MSIDGWMLILMKIEGWKAFNAKPKHQYHVSQCEECVYSTQSQKECRLLWESMFVSFDGRVLISQKWRDKKLLLWSQTINIMFPNMDKLFMLPNHKKNGDYCQNLVLFHLMDELWLLGKWNEENHLMRNQSINIVYPDEKNVFIVPNHKKNCWLFWESKFDSFDEQTLL